MSTANLLPQEPLALALRQRRTLDRPRLLDERRVKSGRDSGDNSVVIPGELGRRDRYRCSPPYMVSRVAQKSRELGLS